MLFDKKVNPGDYEVVKEGANNVLRVNYENYPQIPSVEDSSTTMAKIIDTLIEVPGINMIIFSQRRNYTYSYEQTEILNEIASLFNYLTKQKRILSLGLFDQTETFRVYAQEWGAVIHDMVYNLLRSDPIGAYVELKRKIREEKIKIKETNSMEEVSARTAYIETLSYILKMLDNTKLISLVKPSLSGHVVGSRSVYRDVFRAEIGPDFVFTRLMAEIPLNAEEVDAYNLDEGTDVTIYKLRGDIKYYYHLSPPEFKISEEKYGLLDIARNAMLEYKPKKEEFTDPEKMRKTFFNIGRDMINELAQNKGYDMSYGEIDELAHILVRYTVGFGFIELLLKDTKVQDISVNGPVGETPIFIIHGDYEECTTNIIPAREDGESWATKFRIISGRPLDEANPVLDTELILPYSRARVAAMTRPLNPTGLAFAFRRHRDNPWTYPLFISNRMMGPYAAGLLSFLVDGGRSIIFAGTRSSGKTSLLGSTLIELMRRHRIITIEDTQEIPVDYLRKLGYNIQPMKVRSALTKGGSELGADEGIRTSLRFGDSSLIVGEIRSSIRGNEKVVIIEKGETKRIPIKDLENKDIKEIYVPTLDFDLKIKLSRLNGFVKHPKRRKLLRVKTRTGREITVTPDHSLFTSHNFKIFPMECKDLKIGSKVVLPARLPCGYNDIDNLNLLDTLDDVRVENFEEDVKKVISKIGWKEATKLCDIKCGDIYNYYRRNQKTNIPLASFNKLMLITKENPSLESLRIRNGTSNTLNALLPVNEDFCRFLGYFISEGYYSQSSIKISNNNEKIVSDVINLSKSLFGVDPYVRETEGLGVSKQICISNSPLAKLLGKLRCGRTSREKRIPSFVFGLSKSKIYSFLSGLYAGDGSFSSSVSSSNSIRYFTTSFDLADDLMYLLLHVGIVARLLKRENNGLSNNPIYIIEFKGREYIRKFIDNVDFVKYQVKTVERNVPHSSLDNVSYDVEELERHLKLVRDYRHLRKYRSCGKSFLRKISFDDRSKADSFIKTFANGEFYLDEVKEIKEINLEDGEYVYDLSVDSMQNFIGGTGGILLHNTEAKALYEAMRIGALANLVAGTIHGASPYAVYDRVVNDLGVPKTSFKATDIIVVSNPIKTGMHRQRRVLQITEVRKHWDDDPIKENGFVDLMKYDVKEDVLKPTDALLNGDSDVLKAIASNVKEFVGNWDAILENIQLRADVKRNLVIFANKTNNLELLESDFVVKSNDIFHQISDNVMEDVGSLDSKRILFEWQEWLKKEVKKF